MVYSFIHLVSADIERVPVQLPGRKLSQGDRFGDGEDKLHQRVRHAKNAVMVKYLSAEVCERDHDLNYQPWKELFMLELGKFLRKVFSKLASWHWTSECRA